APIITYNYSGHSFLIDLITTLFHITHQKNKKPVSKKQKKNSKEDDIDETEDNEDNDTISRLNPLDMWNTIYKRHSVIEKFFEDKFIDFNTNKQVKQYENEESVINEIRKWREEEGFSIFYYRLGVYKYETTINKLIGDRLNEYGGLSYFYDRQIIKIYNLLLSSIKYYHDNSTFKLKDLSILNNFTNNKYKEKYFIIKSVNILNIIIDIIRELFYKEEDDPEEDPKAITGLFLDYFIDYLKSYCKKEMLGKCMTVCIIKFKTL